MNASEARLLALNPKDEKEIWISNYIEELKECIKRHAIRGKFSFNYDISLLGIDVTSLAEKTVKKLREDGFLVETEPRGMFYLNCKISW